MFFSPSANCLAYYVKYRSLLYMHRALHFIIQHWSGISGNVKGGLLIVLASLFVAIMASLIKHIGQDFAITQILFIRQLCVALIISPILFKYHRTVFRSNHKSVYLVRVVFSSIAMITGFTAVVHMPLAEVTAISFGRTLFATLLAIIILKEVVGIRRLTGTVIGFLGVIIIIRPDTNNIDVYAILAIISAFFVSTNMIILRKMTQIDSPSTIMAYQAVPITLIMAVPALDFWKTPNLNELVTIIIAGGLMSIIQYVTIQAFKVGEAAALAPMEYAKLLFAVFIGIYFFDETPTIWTLSGAILIIGSTLYTMHRNAVHNQRLGSRARPPNT